MNVPIDHYATVDMDGLHDMIDALGGVNVTSNDTFTTKGTNFVKVNQLMWMEILQWPSYVVVKRKVGGDFGRQERQQLILQAMANKMTSTSALTHFPSLINQIQKNVKTDLTLNDMNDIRKNYKNANTTVNRHQLEGQVVFKTMDCGISYLMTIQNKVPQKY